MAAGSLSSLIVRDDLFHAHIDFSALLQTPLFIILLTPHVVIIPIFVCSDIPYSASHLMFLPFISTSLVGSTPPSHIHSPLWLTPSLTVS